MTPNLDTLEVHFIKNSDFRTVYSSGVFGGFNSQGQLNIDFFNERVPIPTKISYTTTPIEEGFLANEVDREGKTGIVREFQFGVIMNLDAAKNLRDWLDEKVSQYEKASQSIS